MEMALFFDARQLGDPSEEYVAWVDVMGIQATLRRSIGSAANFVYKLHDAALQASGPGLRLYPVMDGFYVSSPERSLLAAFLRAVFLSVAEEHTSQPRERFRFVIRGAVAKGTIYHGSE
jgi:hypothetical protein